MAPTVDIVEAEERHALELADHLRADDLREGEAVSTRTPLERLCYALGVSTHAYAMLVDGRVAFVYGLAPVDMGGRPLAPPERLSSIWAITGTLVDRYPREFWRVTKAEVPRLQGFARELLAFVDARNERSLRWLKRLGFYAHDPIPYGRLGLPFVPCWRTALCATLSRSA